MFPDQLSPRSVPGLNPLLPFAPGTAIGDKMSELRLNHEGEFLKPQPVILLVEPCPIEAVRLRNELVSHTFEVHTARDLISAAHSLSLVQPNLILSQIRLATFNGLELLRWLKEQQLTRLIPVILYTEIATPEERITALELGAVDLLTKPFLTAELIVRVRAALRTRHTLSILERKAYHDSLTGLANRGVLEERLLHEWDICRQRSLPLSVAIVDLDRFKAINDTYGHAAGDIVLCHAAKILAQSVRSSDLVARYGGEEFVIVAPNCSLTAAVALARRFRTKLADQTIAAQNLELKVTASVGVTTADWTQASPSELLRQADTALYQAKRSGRNAVWVYDTSRLEPTEAVASFPAN